jgi:NADH-quinone oxidoreductase subunit N
MLGVLTNAMGQGLMAPIFYMVAYTVTNLAAFGVVMVVERADGHDLQIGDLAGLWERNPWLTVVMALALLSLAGVPPTVGFLAKFQILSAVWSAGSMWLALAAALASAIGAFFYVRTFIQLFSGESTTAAERPAASTTVALAIVGLAIVVLGILPWTVTSVALAGS